jgi:lipopolysaccharide export system permease protein
MIFFNHRILPASNFLFKKVSYKIVQNQANVAVKERVFINQFEGYQIYIDRQLKNGLLSDIRVFSKRGSDDPLQTTLARTGRLITNPETLQVYLRLQDGMVTWNGEDAFKTYNQLHFKNYLLHLNLSNSLARLSSVKKDFLEMDLNELASEIRTTEDATRKRRLQVEYQKRLSLPFACLVVTWVSATLGLWFRRGGFLAFAYGVVLVFIYYLLFVMGEAMSLKRSLSPLLGIWGANAIFAVLGFVMYQIVINERTSYQWLRTWFPRRRIKE